MKSYATEQIRNVALVGHSGAGKTSLTESMLFRTGAINRLGKVDEGNSVSDHDPEEIRRHGSISLSIVPCEWNNHKINVIDTPGYPDFVGEVSEALRVADCAVFVVDGVSGPEVGTELAWKAAEERGLARFFVINRIDRENADFERVVSQLRERFGNGCVPIELPTGTQAAYTGSVDLIEMRARMGDKLTDADIPASMQAGVSRWREELVERAAEQDDDLIEKYLDGQELTHDEFCGALRKGIASGSIMPILAAAAGPNKVGCSLLDALVELAPSPAQRTEHGMKGDTAVDVTVSESGPAAALVFKTAADPFVGKLTYFKVMSGTMKADGHVWNVSREKDERIGSLFVVRGKSQESVPSLAAGDIGVVTKLVDTMTGDTLGARDLGYTLDGISFAEPPFTVALHPKSKADVDKMGGALHKLEEEDRTITVHRDPDTGETLMSAFGEAHVDVSLEKLKRKFGVDLTTTMPRVAYKETITGKTHSEYKHKKQTGGHGQYGHVHLELEPLPRGEGFVFTERVVGGAVPKNFYPAVEKGVTEAKNEGALAHRPVVDVKVTLVDGSYHPVDSSEMAFKLAASQAFKKGILDAHPVLLEPVLDVEIIVPESYMGDILSDMNTKRAAVHGMMTAGGESSITANVPSAEMQRYAIELRSITQGRGRYRTSFSHFQEVPAHLANGIVEEAKKAAEAVPV